MGASLHPDCRLAPCSAPSRRSGNPRVLPASQSSGAPPTISDLGVCPALAPKSHVHPQEEGRMVILFTQRRFRSRALSLLDLLSHWSAISCFGSAGEPAGCAPSPRAPTEPGTQSLSAVLPGCSAEAPRSPLSRREGGSAQGLLRPAASQGVRQCLL